MGKNYEKVNLMLGSTIEEAVEILLHHRSLGKLVSVKFNDKILYSDTVTMDDAYMQIVGKTKAEITTYTIVCDGCGKEIGESKEPVESAVCTECRYV